MHRKIKNDYKRIYVPENHEHRGSYNLFINELTKIVEKYGADTLMNMANEPN